VFQTVLENFTEILSLPQRLQRFIPYLKITTKMDSHFANDIKKTMETDFHQIPLVCYATAAAAAKPTVCGTATAKWQRKNGNGMVETGHYAQKPTCSQVSLLYKLKQEINTQSTSVRTRLRCRVSLLRGMKLKADEGNAELKKKLRKGKLTGV